jgi:hypothetical protein
MPATPFAVGGLPSLFNGGPLRLKLKSKVIGSPLLISFTWSSMIARASALPLLCALLYSQPSLR